MLPNEVPQTERVKVTPIYHLTTLSGTGQGRAWQEDLLGVSGIKAQSSCRLLAKFGLLSVSGHMATSFSKPTQGNSLASNTSQASNLWHFCLWLLQPDLEGLCDEVKYPDYLPNLKGQLIWDFTYICESPSQQYQDQCYWVTREGVCQSGQPGVLGGPI